MFRLCLTAGFFILLSLSSQGQNALPNSGFEAYSTCPTGLGQLDGRLTGWTRANTSTPDYANCSFTGNVAVRTTPRSGSGAVGMWAGASHPSCSSTGYAESIQANLTSPLVIGQTYDISIAARVDGVGSSTSGPNSCMDLGMYFYHSSSPPASNGWCCISVTPQWRVPGGNLLSGTYTLFTGTIVATAAFDRVIIGPFCNGNTGGSSCGTYSTARMYWNLDDAAMLPSTILDEADLKLTGNAFLEFNRLAWELPAGSGWSQVHLERSTDGKGFQVIQEYYPGPEESVFDYRDDTPTEGDNHYRVSVMDVNGMRFTSEVLTLQHGFNERNTAGVLDYHYDRAEQVMRFSLDTGEGGNYHLDVLDVSGRLVGAADFVKGAGEQEFEQPVGAYAEGIYILRLQETSTGRVWQNKLMRR